MVTSTQNVNPATNLIASLNSANSSLANNSTTSSSSSTSAAGLQNSFMTLLVAQLQNQDPMNPMDSSQMTSQLAQISTVDGINTLNSTLQALSTSMATSQSMSAATSLIGHNVLIPGSSISLTTNTPANAGVQLSQPVDNLVVKIQDGSGNTVRTLQLGAQKAGVIPISWDGLTDSGSTAATGTYQLVATATQAGNNIPVPTQSYGTVNSVTMGAAGTAASLSVGQLGTVGLSSVVMIK